LSRFEWHPRGKAGPVNDREVTIDKYVGTWNEADGDRALVPPVAVIDSGNRDSSPWTLVAHIPYCEVCE
jgi:hypothetical protein